MKDYDEYEEEFISASEIIKRSIEPMKELREDRKCKYNDFLNTIDINPKARVVIYNMEEEMKNDIKSGNGFIITDKDGLDKKNSVRMENGIYSPKYGSIWGDENAFEELYSCECKDGKGLKGLRNLDVKCERCGAKVKYKGKNAHMTGWFKLNNYKIIHPNIYYKLGSLIGYTRLREILSPEWISDINGIPQKPVIDENTRNDKKYDHIGMIEFQKRFDEIIEFFYSKKKNKKDVYDFIQENRDKVFTSCLPCIQLFMRPIVLGDEDFNYAKINPKYASLSTKFYNINNKEYTDKEEKILNKRLYSIQKTYFYTCNLIMDMENKKEGHIRNDMLGFKVNFCSRAVITSLCGTKINEIHFPYLAFLEVYRPEILNVLCKLRKITINEAYMIWRKAQLKFDKTIYKIMEYIVDNYECWTLLNRNPTLAYGGIQLLKIVKIKEDYTDLTFSIPINIITKFGADFDGDQMNNFDIKDIYLKKAYSVFDPRANMVISKNDGLFDDGFNLIKDQLIAFHYFNTLGNHKIEVLEGPNGEKKEKPMKHIKIHKIKEEKKDDGLKHIKLHKIK